MPPQHAAALMLQYSKSKGSLRVLLARSQFSLPQVLPPRALAPSLPLSLLIACPVLRQIGLIRGFLCLPEQSRTLPNPPGPSFSPRVRRIPLHLLRLSLPPTTAARWGVVATGLCGEKQAPRPRQPPALHPTIPLHRPRRERGPAHEREGCVCGGGRFCRLPARPCMAFVRLHAVALCCLVRVNAFEDTTCLSR